MSTARIEPVLLSVKEAAYMLSMKPWPLRKLVIEERRIPHGRIGQRIVLHRADVLAFARELTM